MTRPIDIDDARLRVIAGAAATPLERKRTAANAWPQPDEEARRLVDLWRRMVEGRGGEGTFRRRLDALDLNEETALDWLAPPQPWRDAVLPSWTDTLREYRRRLGAFGPVLEPLSAWPAEERMAYCVNDGRLVVFPAWLHPFVDMALERIRADTGALKAGHPAAGSVARAVLVRLSHLAARVISRELETLGAVDAPSPELMFERLTAYPVLLRLLCEETERCAIAFAEVLNRIDSDRSLISERYANGAELGLPVSIIAWRSDPHNGARCACFVRFESGLDVVYKPRSHAIDIAFAQFVSKLEAGGGPELRLPVILDRGDYGWSELLHEQDCPDAQATCRYRERQGALAAIAYFLCGMDFHYENFLAVGEWPVPIDLEALLCLSRHLPEPIARDLPSYLFPVSTSSVLATSMGTYWRTGRDDQSLFVASGIAGCGERLWPQKMPTWEGSEACPRLRWRLRRYEYLDNLPKLSSLPQRIDAAGIEDIERGFRQAYGCINALAADLTRPAGALDHFRGCRTRVVLHDTAEYASILFFSLAPAHLASGRNYWVAMEALSGSLPQYDNLRAEAVLEEDRRCCLVQDIPAWYSTADSTTLEAPSGRPFPGIVQESALEQARIRIRSAGPDDCAFQAGVLRAALLASLVGRADAHAAPSQSPSDFTSLLGWGQLNAAAITPQRQDAAAERERAYDFARKIADTLLTHAIDLPRGKAWLGLTRAAGSISQIAPIVAFPWTCAGAAGTALLFANLHHATPDPRYEEMARAGLAHTVHTIDVVSRTTWWNTASLSAYTGIGFPIYALTEAGRLLNDTSLYERALEITRAIDPDRIRGEANPDWLAGASGFTAALLHLDGIVPDRALKTRAIAAVEAILRVAETTGGSGGILTPGFDRPLLGAAHGAAGIAAACALVYARTEHRGALRMAHHLLEWEREQFDRTAHDWPDLRREEGVPRFMSGWCAGPAGALLARLLAARAINWPDAEEELSQAIGNVAQRLGIDRHHVCCGEGGRILALKAAAVGLGRPELDRQCVHAAANMDRFLDSHGFLHHQEITDPAWTPGLLDGAAGMALAALASVHPGCSNPLSLDHFANRS